MERARNVENYSPSRRKMFQLLGVGCLAIISGTCVPSNLVSEPFLEVTKLRRPEVFGTTVSRLQCEYLGLDYLDTLQKALYFGFDRIRFGSIWPHHEPEEDQYDFRELQQVYSLFRSTNQERFLAHLKPFTATQTVGSSQPRFPEFHFAPYILRRYGWDLWEGDKIVDSRKYLAKRNLQQIELATRLAAEQDFITDIQVENEAISGLSSASGLRLSRPYLLEAIQIVKANKREDQKISLNFPVYLSPARTTEDEQVIEEYMQYADIVGLDVYVRVPNNSGSFDHASDLFWAKLERIRRKVIQSGKVIRISELQGEPWEKQMQAVILEQFENFKSSDPELSTKLISYFVKLGFDEVDIWGFEWWEYLAKMGYPKWKERMLEIAKKRAVKV